MQHDRFGWAPVLGAFRDALERMLDVAAHVARNHPAEVAAVERVRMFVRRRIAGYCAFTRTEDVVLVLVLVAAALERARVPSGAVARVGSSSARPAAALSSPPVA